MSSLRRRAIVVQRARSTERSSTGGRVSARTTAAESFGSAIARSQAIVSRTSGRPKNAAEPALRKGMLRSSSAAAISRLSRPPAPATMQTSAGRASPEREQVLDLARRGLRLRPLVRAAPEAHPGLAPVGGASRGLRPRDRSAAAASAGRSRGPARRRSRRRPRADPGERPPPGSSATLESGNARRKLTAAASPSARWTFSPCSGSQAARTRPCGASSGSSATRGRPASSSSSTSRCAIRPPITSGRSVWRVSSRPSSRISSPSSSTPCRSMIWSWRSKSSLNSTSRSASSRSERPAAPRSAARARSRTASGPTPSALSASMRSSRRASRPAGLPRISCRRSGRSSRWSSRSARRSAGLAVWKNGSRPASSA